MRSIIYLFFCCVVWTSCGSESQPATTTTEVTENKNVGGKCTYKETTGNIEIMSVKEADSRMNNCPNARRVGFTFTSGSEKANGFLTINSGKNPSEVWLKRHSVEIGKTFAAVKKDIQEGTCTPIVWEFPDLDTMPEKACE